MGSAVGGAGAGVDVAVLGPAEARRDGTPVDLGTPKQRAVLAALALAAGRPVPVDTLLDLLWGQAPPPQATGTLQAYVSGLRRSLEPARERRAPATLLVTVAPGYALRLPRDRVDATCFEDVVEAEHRRLAGPVLAPPALSAGELGDAAARLRAALRLWRGRPYAELGDAPAVMAGRAHLEELRLVAEEDLAVARLALGEHATVAAELEALTAAHPLRERLWALRAVALVRAGRQADALAALRAVRDRLADELGIDPGPELRDLQDRVLRQDAALEASPPDAPDIAPGPVPPGGGPGIADLSWPFLGRDGERALLRGALADAVAGRTAFAAVTGEPGIGKSRLVAELAEEARRAGARVLVGRCSQDDGAPPLWPWAAVVEQLGTLLPHEEAAADAGGGAEFRARERLVRVVREAAAERLVLLVLDDLHWADTASLRVLRLLTETAHSDRLLVVATWRDRPRPAGALADVAESFARRHAVRVELGGLDEAGVAGLVGAVTGRAAAADEAAALRDRTDGNPFFVLEYARLAGATADLPRLLGEPDPPTVVQEVVGRRLDRLPAETVEVLRTAAVVGRAFDLVTLAAATGADVDAVLDLVDPAVAAGLVREEGADRFAFAHALVRDTLDSRLASARQARRHAAVARVVGSIPGRETEAARHWLRAGPAHAARAWRAAAEAAEVALGAFAHQEAVGLLRAGLAAMDDDPDATLHDRYGLLMQLVAAYRWAAMWPELTDAVRQAVQVADRLGDPVLAAEAATAPTSGGLWQSAPYGSVNPDVVAALRRSLAALPATDAPLRCRCMLSLANELYYAVSFEERRALVDEALAMAERIGDPSLLIDAYQTGYLALWVPRTAEERLGYADRALALARSTGAATAEALAATLRAVALSEAGRPAQMWPALEEARALCERLRLPYGLLVLDNLAVGWRAMAGRFEECHRLLRSVVALSRQVSLTHADDAVDGARLTVALWEGRVDDALAVLQGREGTPFEMTATVAVLLWHAGRTRDAAGLVAEHPIRLDHEDWFSALAWCHAAEASLFLGLPDVAAGAYARLAPLAGCCGSAGSGSTCGPVDGYLAMAAAAAGDRALAARHADRALELAQQWGLPPVARWLRDRRERFGF